MNVMNGKYPAVLLPLLFVLMGQGPSERPNLDVTLRVTTSRSSFLQGEDTYVRVSFTTKSVRPAALSNPVVWNGKSFLYFEIKDDSGSVLKYGGPMVTGPLYKVTFSKSQPYQQYVNLRWIYDLTTPGIYKLRAMYYNPITKFRIVSPEQTIEIKKVDSLQIVSSKKVSQNRTHELVRVKYGKDELYLLRDCIGTGKKRWYGRCPRIKMDKDFAKRASIVQVVGGQKYRGLKIAMGDKVMIVNVQVGGPQVLTRTVNRRADDVELKLARDKKYMLVGKDGKEFPVLEPTSKPATQPTSNPANSEKRKTTTQPHKSNSDVDAKDSTDINNGGEQENGR